MPRGTCVVCGCTQERACAGGCCWVWKDEQHCDQCVGWVLLRTPNTYQGILPYDLWPVRNLHPIPTGGPHGEVWLLDIRRCTAEQLERIGYVAASLLGLTVEEFLAEVATGRDPFVIRHRNITRTLVARDVEQAAAMMEEFAATGRIVGGLSVEFDGQGNIISETR